MTRLLFRRPRDPAQRDIVFGRPAGPAIDAEGRLFISFPPVSLIFTGRLEYDLAVSRSDMISTGGSWGAAAPVSPASTVARYRAGLPVSAAHRLTWRPATAQAATTRAPWRQLASVPTSKTAAWSSGRPAGAVAAGGWQTGLMLRNSARAPWQSGRPTPAAAAAPWQIAVIIRRPGDRIRWGAGDPTPISVAVRAASAVTVLPVAVRLPWDAAERLPPGRTVIIIPPHPPVWRCYTPPSGDQAHLLFDERRQAGADILFACGRGRPGGSITVPILRTYIVINNVTLVRLPDNTALQAYSLSLKWDIDSWSVGWSASLPAAALDAVMPTGIGEPVELLATINETPVRLLAESIARDRRFGDARLNVGGRGRVAWLAAPYAPTVARAASSAMTSQQIAADALTDNGVPIGWGLNWQIPDWLVPAGVWSHQGSRIDAVRRIAEAAGGYVLGHRTDQTLHVRPRYPLLPWEWSAATPDLIIPAAVASTEAIAWSESPSYNRVFVAGQEQGRTGQITRAGTAGDILAPMVTDPLITHADAARARGASILAAGGRQATVTLRLPVLPETGILDLGQLIEYQDGSTARRGLVRAVAVDVGRPTVWQTVEIETHA